MPLAPFRANESASSRAARRGRTRSVGARHAALVATAVVLGWAPRARAQATSDAHPDPASDTVTLARNLFRLGLAAASDARWVDAQQYFERAYALVPEPTILFNVASSQTQTGHLRAAVESYHRFLRDAPGGPSADQHGVAERLLREVEQRLAHAQLHLRLPLPPDERVLLDGTPVDAAALAAPLALDPGEHVVTLERGGARIARSTVHVFERQSVDVALDVASSLTQPNPPFYPADPHPRGRAASPWVAIGATAGGVVALGTAAALLTYAFVTPGPAVGGTASGTVVTR